MTAPPEKQDHTFQFSLAHLMLGMLGVAVYLGIAESLNWNTAFLQVGALVTSPPRPWAATFFLVSPVRRRCKQDPGSDILGRSCFAQSEIVTGLTGIVCHSFGLFFVTLGYMRLL